MTADPLALVDLIGGTIAGVVVLLFIGGYVWAKPAVDALIVAMNKKDEDLDALRTSIEERIIPTIEANTLLASRVATLLEERDRIDREVVAALDRVTPSDM